MEESLRHITQHGTFPPTHDSKEDRNTISACPVSDPVIAEVKAAEVKAEVEKWAASPAGEALKSKRLCILDGFLMYPESMAQIQPYLSLKLFVRTTHAKCKQRREARDGYATVESWWVDPPGYVDKIVWPNYVRDHGLLFEGGDVEGKYKKDVLEKEKIEVISEDKEGNMEEMLRWVVDEVKVAVEKEGKEKSA